MTIVGTTCAVVAGLAVSYAVEEARRLRSGRRFRFVGKGQAVRRVAGSLLVAALMVLVDVGLEVIEPHRAPVAFLAVWATATLLVLLVLVLALLDLREIRAHQEIESAREVLRIHAEKEAERAREAEAAKRPGEGRAGRG